MLKWLSSLGSENDLAKARAYLDGLTGTPAAIVQQVCDWVGEQIKDGDTTLEMVRAAEDRLVPVLSEIVGQCDQQRRNTALPRLLRKYAESFARAYAVLFRRLPSGSATSNTAGVRAAYLYGQASRSARKSYDDPVTLRAEMMTFLAKAHQLGAAANKVRLLPAIPETSIAQELAIAFLWDTSPFDALTLEQIEYLDRFMSYFGNRISTKSTPGATAPFAVLPDGRVVAPGQADPSGAVLFVGPGQLSGLLAGLLKEDDDQVLPEWAGKPLPHTNMKTLKAMAQRLSITWERKRIKRGSERIARHDEVRVAGSFENIRRAVAYSSYVRGGGTLNAYTTRGPRVSDRMREVMVGIEDPDRTHSPIEILAAMEATGDKQAIESWRATDSSSTGYSMVLPGFRPWLAIGALIAIREPDQVDWQIGVVRRLYSASGGRRVGTEIIPGKAIPAGVAKESCPDKLDLADLRDAVLLQTGKEQLLVTAFAFMVGDFVTLASFEGRRVFKVTGRFIDTPDYSISIIEPAGAVS